MMDLAEKHHYGMCGGGCRYCYEDQMYDDYRRQQQRQEPTVEEMCFPHPYDGDDLDSGRCYCGEVRYPFGGPPPS